MNKEQIKGMIIFDLQKAIEDEDISREENDDTVTSYLEARVLTLQEVLKYFEI